jgi:hypothetical protein
MMSDLAHCRGVFLLGWALLCIPACSPPAPGPAADSARLGAVRTADSAKIPARPGVNNGIPTAADWSAADSATVRLSPTAFPELPASIVRALLARGCTIPQPWRVEKTRNVIRGEFARRGQRDWAVLCSRNMESAVLVFWNAAADSVAEHPSVPDLSFLQGVGDDQIGFSRIIGVAGRTYILDHHREYGGPKPPPIDHDGIEDAFEGKASAILYFYKGKWLTLAGAD